MRLRSWPATIFNLVVMATAVWAAWDIVVNGGRLDWYIQLVLVVGFGLRCLNDALEGKW